MTRFQILEEVEHIYSEWGSQFYSEKITQVAHGVQCALLAEQSGESDSLILAALLHDIGHLTDLGENRGREVHDHDTVHEAAGARALASIFPASVTAPIAMHVDAKRYLCTKQPGYFETLSEASVASLVLQGGPMSEDEARRFEAMPNSEQAIKLRIWDDLGKDTEQEAVPMAEFTRLLHQYSRALTTGNQS